jgi:hypothetical protein
VTRRHLIPKVAALVSALALVACSRPAGPNGASSATSSAPRREVLVAIGSRATLGDGLDNPLRDSWPQLLYHDAFPRSTVLINSANRSVTVERARGQALSIALEVHATVVAVWLGDLELGAGLEPSGFEAELDQLVTRLRDSGARVLVGNLPGAQSGVAAYNGAIARVVRARGATLVDLAAALSTHPESRPSSAADGATSRIVAATFAAALTQP